MGESTEQGSQQNSEIKDQRNSQISVWATEYDEAPFMGFGILEEDRQGVMMEQEP